MRRSDEHPIDLQEFAQKGFEALGGVLDRPEREVLEILIPDELSAHFGGRNFFQVFFSPEERTAFEGEATLFSIGSPLLDRLTELISRQGFLSRAYLNPFRLEGGIWNTNYPKESASPMPDLPCSTTLFRKPPMPFSILRSPS